MENKYIVGKVYIDRDGDLIQFLGNNAWQWITFERVPAEQKFNLGTSLLLNEYDCERLNIRELTPLEEVLL